jgi:ABC-2 type transport system ATP-binding protein
MAAGAVVEFKHVVKDYPLDLFGRRKLRALDDICLTIQRGEVFGLIGPNRAGKTTLVKILLSLCHPTSGTIIRLDRPYQDRRTLGRVGYVHENHAFPRYHTAQTLLELYGTLSGVPAAVLQTRIPELLEKIGLADRATDPIGRYSKGMLQRLGLAQALINDPELLVFDEPNEGLDLYGRQLVAELIRGQRELGRSAILITHALTDVENLCDRVGVILNGRLIHVGPTQELLKDPKRKGQSRSLEAALTQLYEEAV